MILRSLLILVPYINFSETNNCYPSRQFFFELTYFIPELSKNTRQLLTPSIWCFFVIFYFLCPLRCFEFNGTDFILRYFRNRVQCGYGQIIRVLFSRKMEISKNQTRRNPFCYQCLADGHTT